MAMKDAILICGVALIVFGLILLLLPSALTQTISRNFWVNSYSTMTLSYHFNSGDTMECSVTITGGNNDIKVYIKDPLGVTIPWPLYVQEHEDFSYTADVSGVYIIYFDNSFSSYSKQVSLSMKIKPALANSPFPLMLFIMGFVITAIRYYVIKLEKDAVRYATY